MRTSRISTDRYENSKPLVLMKLYLSMSIRNIGISNSFRGTAIMGAMGAAIAVATAMDLTVDQIASAASFAIHHGFGLNEWAWSGTGEDVFSERMGCTEWFICSKDGRSRYPWRYDHFRRALWLAQSFLRNTVRRLSHRAPRGTLLYYGCSF